MLKAKHKCQLYPLTCYIHQIERSSRATHPGTLKPGDVVNVGLSFRLLHFSGKGRFQLRLDSIAVLDRRGSDVSVFR